MHKVAMSSRQRIEAVFSGREPDRFPICEQAFASSVASAVLGREAFTGSTDIHFFEGLAWMRGEQAHAEFEEKIYADAIALHRHYAFDILFLPWRMTSRPAGQLDERTLLYGDPQGTWYLFRYDPDSRTCGVAETNEDNSMDAALAAMRAQIAAAERTDSAATLDPLLLRALREHGGEFEIAGASGLGIPMQTGWLEATLLEPGLVADWLDVRMETVLAGLEAQKRAGVRLINGGGDFAFNSGQIYSPAFFDAVMAPRWKRIFDRCRDLGLWYVMRSDGDLWPVAETLFGRCHPHAYYEVDADAGMRFADLRRAFPDLVLFGNVSCTLLRNGTPARVRAAALDCLEAAAPRFVGGSANAVLHGTPPENLSALYDAITSVRP